LCIIDIGETIVGFVVLSPREESIVVAYGPILPDAQTNEEVNRRLKENHFLSSCLGTILPLRKELKSVSFSQDKFKVEGKDFSHDMATSDILKVENSGSEPKGLKIKTIKESTRSSPDLRMVFPDLATKNTFLLLYFNWTKEKLLLNKATDMYMLECLPILDFSNGLLAPHRASEQTPAIQQQTPDNKHLEEMKAAYEARISSLEADLARLKLENSSL